MSIKFELTYVMCAPYRGAHRYLCNHVQRFLQAGAHCIGRGKLGIVIQMRVNIGRGGKVAVPEPFLNLLHGYAVGEKKRGAAMTQIMKANPAKPMTFENPWEDLREIIGLDQIAELINADIFAVFSVVALAAQPATVLLIFSLTQKSFFEDRDKRKRPHARFCLCGVCSCLNLLPVEIAGCNGMSDRNRIVLKINGIPFQANRLTSAQTVEGSEKNRDFKLGSLYRLEKLLNLIAVIKAADEFCDLGPVHSVRRIHVNQLNLYRIFQRSVKHRVVMDNSSWGYTPELLGIEGLNVKRFQFAEGDTRFLK